MSIYKALSDVQLAVKSPKGREVSFGNTHYTYRNAEDIFASAKEAITRLKVDAAIVVDTKAELIGEVVFYRSVARFIYGDSEVTSEASVKEDIVGLNSRGQPMTRNSQNSGAAISMSRKYALQGLLAIDDSSLDVDRLNAEDQISAKMDEIGKTSKAERIKDSVEDSAPSDHYNVDDPKERFGSLSPEEAIELAGNSALSLDEKRALYMVSKERGFSQNDLLKIAAKSKGAK